jgi:peptidoglycan/xylan/chitin deacetylase (PgdA/CDA1 family)
MIILLAVIVGSALLAHSAPFPFLMEAFRPARSVWRVKPVPGSPALYLTFDDGPNREWTPAVLDALRDTGARATFFLIDEQITLETEGIVRRIAAEGHGIGLHSGTRRLMIQPPEALAGRLRAAARRIESLAGREPCRLFRPHGGWRSASMYDALQRLDYRLAGWSWGMWDWNWWRRPTADAVARRLLRKASPGDIVVIHDGHHKDPHADRRHAGGTVRLLVPPLRARGFEFRPLCEPAPG